MRKIRCLVIGLGAVGQATARLLIEKGVSIVGAYGRSRNIGRDLGELTLGAPCGVRVRPISQLRVARGDADLALFCTTGRPEDLLGEARQCLLAGINVLTIAEGAFFPWHYRPEVAGALDQAALQGSATLSASGFQDGIMMHLVAAATCAMPSARQIEFHAFNDFAPLGVGSTGRMQLGETAERFLEAASAPPAEPGRPPLSTTGQIVEALAAHLGLGQVQLTYRLEAVLALSDVWSSLLGRTIPAGRVCGFTETVTGTTNGGMDIVGRLTAKLFEPGEVEWFSCSIHGSTPTTLHISPTYGLEGTAATLVNRVPDIIHAPPGFLTVDRLPAPRLRSAFDFEID